jgi:hydroxyacylglutathione hydrolase
MNRRNKIIIWILGSIVGLIIIAAAVYIINFIIATHSMSPSDTGAINDSVWCIRDKFVNAYIFKGNKGYLMIDAGIGEKSFARELMKTGISPGQITAILLTHTDGDHIGAISLFKNASVFMHTDEEQMVNGTTGKTKYSRSKWKYGPYILLSSDQIIDIDGIKIKTIHTPGHTPGSCCFIIGNDYFVTGDNLIVNGNSYEPFNDAFNMNTEQQEESIKTLPPLESFKYILTGHYGITKVEKH